MFNILPLVNYSVYMGYSQRYVQSDGFRLLTGTYYTFDNKGCHRLSNFLTTKVFTVYLDKNTIYSVGNPEREETEVVFHDGSEQLL